MAAAGGAVVGGVAAAAAFEYKDNQSALEEQMRIKAEEQEKLAE